MGEWEALFPPGFLLILPKEEILSAQHSSLSHPGREDRTRLVTPDSPKDG